MSGVSPEIHLLSDEDLKSVFETVIHNSPDGVITVDSEGIIVFSNPAADRMFGYTSLEGKRVDLLVPESLRDDLNAKMREYRMEGKHELAGRLFETTSLRSDGTEFPVEMSLNPARTSGGLFLTSIIRDISERRKMGAEIHRREEQFRDLFENANDMIQAVDPEGRFVYVNRAWMETLGYTEDDLENLTLFDVIHPDKLDECHEIFRRVMSGESISLVETAFITKDGEKIFVEGNVNVRMRNGEVEYSRAIFRDVTERVKFQRELERLASIVESSGDAIVSYDLDGTIIDWNRGAERIYGYSAEEARGQNVSMLMDEEEFERLRNLISEVRSGKLVSNFEARRLRKDGEEIWVSISLSPLRDVNGEIIGVSTIARDITEIKRTQEALRASEEKYRKIVEKFIQNALALISEINR
ncbi:PAS domain S-box protein [Methanothermobacter sp. KEPCO-1]|uniref:PAS domain S-box protein n=1 Tax=Methanothermobacter sp. KEPCO-1 TaxID=2603820 RepID=UPI0011C7C04E|nr:PAS domain S-box protein [Methanothermobacter sp. KEPCO-1]QEF95028.1 PAS domain S-box protein [Methanothermobacter sp. KEPCO-1]